jgi:formamidopyrimidine-DNA glycosylase
MELPETLVVSQQMKKELVGARISFVEISNPKCLNVPLEEFTEMVIGKEISSVEARGKWFLIYLNSHILLFNPGMGAEILYFTPDDDLPEKYQIKIGFEDRTGLTIRVWWFCYLHLVSVERAGTHTMTAKLGLSPLDESFTLEYFSNLFHKRRGYIKSFLLNQKNVAGIGNFYIHDILFDAGIHPLRKIPTLTKAEIGALYHSMQSLLSKSLERRGSTYEKDFYGDYGRFDAKEHFRVGYNSGACPVCHTQVQKIKTGSTSSYVCPKCQPL